MHKQPVLLGGLPKYKSKYMYIQNSIEIKGATGKVYTFDLYPKSSQLLETGGVYILTYCHPRGHLSGLKVNILHIGVTNNLNSAINNFRLDKTMCEKNWNYTAIIVIDTKDLRHEYFTDLSNADLIPKQT